MLLHEDRMAAVRSLLDALPGYVMLVDDEHNIVLANQALAGATGMRPEDVVGKYCPKAIHGQDHPFPGCPLEEAMAQGGSVEKEMRDERSGLWLASCIYPTGLVSPAGRPLFLHTTRDISEIRQARAQVARELAERTVLHDLLQTSVSTPGLDQYLEYFVQRLTSLPWLRVETKGAIFLVEDEPDVLVMKTQSEMAEPLLLDCARVPFGRCLCGRAAQTGKPIHAAVLDDRHETRFDGMPDHGHYCVPLLSGTNHVLGVLNLYLHAGHEQDDKELAFLLAASSLLAGTVERKWAEEKLCASEQRFRDVSESTGEYIWETDPQGHIVSVTERVTDVLGYAVTELMVGTPFDVILPEDVPGVSQMFAQSAAGRVSFRDMEYRVRHKSGRTVWVSSSALPLLDAAGDLRGYRGTTRDITERKRAEEEIELLSRFPEESPNPVLRVLPDGTVVYANRSSKPLLDSWKYTPGVRLPEVWQERIREALSSGRKCEFEETHRNTVWLFLLVPVAARGYVNAYGRDITERKQANEEITQAKRRLEHLVRSSPVVIYTSKASGDYGTTYVSGNVVELVGFGPSDFLDDPGVWLDHIHPEDRDRVLADMPQMFEQPSYVHEYRCRKKDGDYIWVRDEVRVLRDAQGQPIEAVGSWSDITERKRAEEELRTAFAEIRLLKEQLEAENVYLRREIKLEHVHGDIVGESPAIKQTLALVEQVAPTHSTVLIQGETGTGKELLARSIHNLSPRKDRPLITVSCAAMPSTLIESELFGREKGAYTGALARQAGRFEVADKSTLFLDEIGELSPEAQTKLLRVLQEGKFERLGSSTTVTVDVRVVAATNRNLEQAVKDGRFREDLFYRLNIFPITIPPLRERREDIPVLVWTFIREFNEKMGKRIESIPKRTLEALSDHPWPGNVRALRNTIERAMILSTDTTLQIELPDARPGVAGPTRLNEAQRSHVTQVLESTNWRIRGKGGAAELLGLKSTTLEYRIKKLGIQRRPEDKS